jgi:GNAT superfamily N-acetyltransferase
MNATVVVRPVRDVDAEELGRVQAACWHETYDHLVSEAALTRLSPKRMAELWVHYAGLGPAYSHVAVLVDGEIVGFAGAGPSRDPELPGVRELHFIYLRAEFQGQGLGQRLFDAVIQPGPAFLWVASDNPRAHRFYERNGFRLDGAEHTEPFLGEQIHEVRFVR